MSLQENLKFKEMLSHMQSIKDENKKLRLENEELKGKLGGMTR
jgi:regulator of replication initiation timing